MPHIVGCYCCITATSGFLQSVLVTKWCQTSFRRLKQEKSGIIHVERYFAIFPLKNLIPHWNFYENYQSKNPLRVRFMLWLKFKSSWSMWKMTLNIGRLESLAKKVWRPWPEHWQIGNIYQQCVRYCVQSILKGLSSGWNKRVWFSPPSAPIKAPSQSQGVLPRRAAERMEHFRNSAPGA